MVAKGGAGQGLCPVPPVIRLVRDKFLTQK